MRCQHAHCPLILPAHRPHSGPGRQAIGPMRSLRNQACDTGDQGREVTRLVRKLPRCPRSQSAALPSISRLTAARTRYAAQSGRVRGRPKRGRMPGSKRVMALIWWPARVSTSRPFAWAIAARGSRRYRPNAGCPLARVGIRRYLPPWKAHAKNRAASSRPWPRTGPPGLAPGRRALPAGRRGRARARPPYRRGWVRVARNQVRSSAGAG